MCFGLASGSRGLRRHPGGIDGDVPVPPSEARALRRSAGLCSSVGSLRPNNRRCPMSGASSAADEGILVTPDQVTWADSPVIPGAKGAFLVGDPSKAEVTVLRVKLPPHCKHPPHTHPFAEVATVLSGRLGYGLGNAFDTRKAICWRRAPSPSSWPSGPITFGPTLALCLGPDRPPGRPQPTDERFFPQLSATAAPRRLISRRCRRIQRSPTPVSSHTVCLTCGCGREALQPPR